MGSLESLFNIAWTLLAVSGIAAGLVFRDRFVSRGLGGLARDMALLAIIAFLLFPAISISDDIHYFDYYFSGGTPDGVLWLQVSRREKQFFALLFLQAVALLVVAIACARHRSIVLGMVALTSLAAVATRAATTAHLRAPPFFLL